MEKALEIIDNAIEILNKTRSMFFADHTVYGGFKKSDFNKAINGLTIISAKIEETMKPKTCKLCAYCEPFNSVCFNDKSQLCADFVNSEYGCIYWERKATT